MALVNFNANTVEPAKAFEPLPDGWYIAAIVESEVCQSQANPQNKYLKLQLKVQGGEHNGRILFHNLNLWNMSPIAVKIAEEQLSAICHATGVIQVEDSTQLHGIPFAVKVKLEPPKGIYEASNSIKGFDLATARQGSLNTGETAPAPAPSAPPSSPPARPAPPPKKAAKKAVKTPPPPKAKTPAPPPPPPKKEKEEPTTYPTKEAALADGWIQHPDSAEALYKGQEVKSLDDLVVPESPGSASATTPDSVPEVVEQQGTPDWAKD